MLHNLSLLRFDRLLVRSDESKRWACGVDADPKELFPDSRRGLNLGLSTASLLPRQIHDQVCHLHLQFSPKAFQMAQRTGAIAPLSRRAMVRI